MALWIKSNYNVLRFSLWRCLLRIWLDLVREEGSVERAGRCVEHGAGLSLGCRDSCLTPLNSVSNL